MFIIDLLFIRHFGRPFLLYLGLARDYVVLFRIIENYFCNLTLKTLQTTIYSKWVLIFKPCSCSTLLFKPTNVAQLTVAWDFKIKNSIHRSRFFRKAFWIVDDPLSMEISLEITLTFPLKIWTELKTLEWNILNPDQLIDLKIINKRKTSII